MFARFSLAASLLSLAACQSLTPTASTPAVTLASKGFKKVAALLGNDRRA